MSNTDIYYVAKDFNFSCSAINIDKNMKYFLSSILEWMLKDHMTVKTGAMMLKIPQLLNC